MNGFQLTSTIDFETNSEWHKIDYYASKLQNNQVLTVDDDWYNLCGEITDYDPNFNEYKYSYQEIIF